MSKTFLKTLLPLIIFWVLINWVIRPDRYNMEENRYLAAEPAFTIQKLLDGSYGAEWEQYAQERVSGRDFWTSFHSSAGMVMGVREWNGVFLGSDGSLLQRLDPPDRATVEQNIQGLADCREQQPDQNMLFALIPSAAGVTPEKLPAFAQVWDQQKWIRETEAALPETVTTVDLASALSAHREELYYRTDHHWTTLGAYYAYRELAAALDLPVRELEDFTSEAVTDQFNGTLYSRSRFRGVAADTIHSRSIGFVTEAVYGIGDQAETRSSLFFPEYLTQKDKYAWFLGQNQPLVTIRTQADNGKKLLLFKDSYSHCLVPFFTADYEEIVLADLRYLNQPLPELLSLEDYEDVLFLYSVDVFSHQKQTGKLPALLKED